MDLNEFLTLERLQLLQERKRLSSISNANWQNQNQNKEKEVQLHRNAVMGKCPAALLMQRPDYIPTKCNEPALATGNGSRSNTDAAQSQTLCIDEDDGGSVGLEVEDSSLNLDLVLSEDMPSARSSNVASASPFLRKSAKEIVNQRELLVGSARAYKSPNVSPPKRPQSENRLPIRLNKKAVDDMEQWVTDTFYAYFPGFNNENQKRQNYLRERQRENQQNFLRHQMLHAQPPPAIQKNVESQQRNPTKALNLSGNSTGTGTSTSTTTDKTDLELIVNSNPNYVPPKVLGHQSKIRPGTTRHRLMQDLGHVELSNIVTGDGIMERNLRSAELETARKKDYQRDLMQQIEEKRLAIERLREKERRQEEALTRRLEAQLKTIQLEEQLEKERMRAEKTRIDSEHNRMMRDQLLAKLEKDTQMLSTLPKTTNNLAGTSTTTANKPLNNNPSNNGNTNASTTDSNANKVYKYFSNSAHHEYRRGQPLPPAVDLNFEIPQMVKIERECFHLCEKICPLCDEPLKSYESCCLRCQRKLALKMKQRLPKKPAVGGESGETDETGNVEYEEAEDDEEDEAHNCHSSYALVCLKCERLYALCTTCLAKSDVCRACQRQRNVCMNCRRTLCSFCLEEIACGKDTERSHINEPERGEEDGERRQENAFRVLEVNYSVPQGQESNSENLRSTQDEPEESPSPPPYSINIGRNSVFHEDYKPTPVKQTTFIDQPLMLPSSSANTSFELDSADEQAIERVRRQTNQHLSRYLKNYGDLAAHPMQRSKSESRHRGTQTTPQSTDRRDIVLRESASHNLSMPLLREMPKMTRKDTALMAQSQNLNNQRKMDNLKKRWEVPAVQKFTVSSTSPKILTQVGAIRKQLQAARFLDEAGDY